MHNEFTVVSKIFFRILPPVTIFECLCRYLYTMGISNWYPCCFLYFTIIFMIDLFKSILSRLYNWTRWFGSPANSRRKFSKQKKFRPLPSSVHSCTCAEPGIRSSFTSILSSPVCSCLHTTHWTSGHPRHVFEVEKKLMVAVYQLHQSVLELSSFWCFIWQKKSLFWVLCEASSTCQVWQDGGVMWSLSSSPTGIPGVLTFSSTQWQSSSLSPVSSEWWVDFVY